MSSDISCEPTCQAVSVDGGAASASVPTSADVVAVASDVRSAAATDGATIADVAAATNTVAGVISDGGNAAPFTMKSWWESWEEDAAQRASDERKKEELKKQMEFWQQFPLTSGPWITPAEKRNWEPHLCTAAASGSFACWGVREALSFRVASSNCRRALEQDMEWHALLLLSSSRQRTAQLGMKWPAPEEWVAAYEKIMHFCLQDSTLDFRLKLNGIDADFEEDYATHDALRFGLVHLALTGAVFCLHLGYSDDAMPPRVRDECDWSVIGGLTQHFPEQLLKSSSLQAVVSWQGTKTVFAEVHHEEDDEDWPESKIISHGGARMNLHRTTCCCCEFALHIELQVPSAFFAQVVLLHLEPFHPFNLNLQRESNDPLHQANKEDQQCKMWLMCEFWNSQAVAPYATHLGDSDGDLLGQYYDSLRCHCCIELPTAVTAVDCRRVVEYLMDDRLDHDVVGSCFDMILSPGVADIFGTLYDLPDRISLWALDNNGRTYFQLHGLLSEFSSNRHIVAQEAPILFHVDLDGRTKKFQLVVVLPQQLVPAVLGHMFSSQVVQSNAMPTDFIV